MRGLRRDQESLWTPRFSLSTVISLDQRKSSAVLPELVKRDCCDHDALDLYIEASPDIDQQGTLGRLYLCLLNDASSCGMMARGFALLID